MVFRVILLFCVAWSAQAGGVYKIVGADGKVTFSDRPAPGAKPVEVRKLQTYSAPPVPATEASADAGDKEADVKYETFSITTPAANQTFRDNGGTIPVALTVTPGLHLGHDIAVYLDGQKIGQGKSTELTISDVDRGTHSVRAEILDKSGQVVAGAAAVTFFLKRTFKKP